MKTAFVLAGGGAAGAYQMGCLKAVLEAGIKPDFMTANSAGALNAAGLSYAGITELERVWRGIRKREDVFADRFFGLIPALLGSNSLWTSKPLKKLIASIMASRVAKIPFWVNYVDLRTGNLVHAKDKPSLFFEKEVLASASLPVLTEPVDGYFVDGGVRENTPLKLAIDQGAERIFVFLNSPREKRVAQQSSFKGLKDIASRTLQIMSDEMHWNDIETCLEYNAEGIGRKIEIHWIAPQIRTIGTLDFNQNAISAAISQGYADAKAYCRTIGGV